MALTATLQNGGAPYKLEAVDTAFTTTAFTSTSGGEIWAMWIVQHDSGSTAPNPTWSNNQSLTRDDVVSATNGATDFSSGIFVHRYKVTSGASTTLTATMPSTAFGNIYAFVWIVTGQDTTDSRGGTASGVAGANNGAFALTLSAAPASGDFQIEGIVGTLNTGTGKIDQDASFTEVIDAAHTDQIIYEVATRTSSTSTTAGWADVSNNTTPVDYYHLPVGVAFNIKASGGGGGGSAQPRILLLGVG